MLHCFSRPLLPFAYLLITILYVNRLPYLLQQLVLDLESLQAEHTALKQKFNATIARNKIITTALKDSQQQVTVLLEKEKHDSELIAALMAQQVRRKVFVSIMNIMSLG